MGMATVTIVEDDAAVRESLAWMLRRERLHVVAFERPEHLLAAIDCNSPGCLLLDLNLPGMHAFELYEKIVALGCNLPFIVMTGHGEIEDACNAIRRGAIDFLEKPINREKLLNCIWQALGEDLIERRDPSHSDCVLTFASSFMCTGREVLAVAHGWGVGIV